MESVIKIEDLPAKRRNVKLTLQSNLVIMPNVCVLVHGLLDDRGTY